MRRLIITTMTVVGLAAAGMTLSTSAAASNESTDVQIDTGCDLLGELRVETEDRTGYDYDLFGYDSGPARDELLTVSENEHDGEYLSVYDNTFYDDAGEVDIDHTVALAEAWDSGADEWGESKRHQFGNDTSNMTLLTVSVNRGEKSDNDIVEWLPPYDGAIGQYVGTWLTVKTEYDLSIDPAEQEALDGLLGGCEGDESDGDDEGDSDESDNDSNLPTRINTGR